jgi:hypothetical protein
MEEWWTGGGKPHALAGLCYTSDPDLAEYLVVWQDHSVTIRRSYEVVLAAPSLPGTSGSYSDTGGTSSSAGGWVPREYAERRVTVSVYLMPSGRVQAGLPAGDALFSTTRTGSWPWSKPDKDGLREALSRLNIPATR